jgi:hypothetical protein
VDSRRQERGAHHEIRESAYAERSHSRRSRGPLERPESGVAVISAELSSHVEQFTPVDRWRYIVRSNEKTIHHASLRKHSGCLNDRRAVG